MSALLLLVVVAAASVLHVTDTSSDCFHHDGAEERLQRGASGYGHAERVVPLDAVEHLRAVLVHSEHPFDATALGITPEAVAAHRAQLAARAHLSHADSEKLDVARIAHVVETHLMHPEGMSTSSIEVDVHLDDGKALAVWSGHPSGLMVPWHVTIDGRSWDSFDPAIASAVAPLLPTVSQNRSLVQDAAHWRTRLWDEPWQDWFAQTDDRDRGLERARRLPGFADASRAWVVDANLEEGKLTIVLEPRVSSLFERVEWRVDATLPTFDAVLRRIGLAERGLRASKGFTAWRDGGMNEVSLELGEMRLRPLAEGLWRDAALRGSPDAQVEMTGDGTRLSARLFAGRDDARAVASETLGAPGIGGLTSAVGGNDSEYVIADPSGTLIRKPFSKGLEFLTATPP